MSISQVYTVTPGKHTVSHVHVWSWRNRQTQAKCQILAHDSHFGLAARHCVMLAKCLSEPEVTSVQTWASALLIVLFV